MLQIRLFGRGQAHYSDHPLTGFPCQQAHLLLCYLLLNRHHICHREQLAAVFWGEYPTTTSRKYLRNALWRLRNALQSIDACADEYLSIDDDSVTFLSSSRYWLDTEAFEATATRYQDLSGQGLTSQQAAHLEEAVDLCSGDLLEGVYEDWCPYDRERLSLMRLNALSKLMAFHGAHGTYERGLTYGERILARDNTREKVHRQMMWLYWQLGNRGAALAQYKLCIQIMQEVLGVSPMEKTTRLYQQMKHGRFNPRDWPSLHNAPPPTGIRSDEATQQLAKQTLRKVHYLQAAIELISTELYAIEQQLSNTLTGS